MSEVQAAHKPTATATWRLIAYASPAMVTYLAWMPLGYVIAKFYAKYTALDLATIGLIIFVGRIFDAAIDPLVAY
ncbi:MAG TPA: MFS transporter, partial [Verrucomicrobiae bacterium]|nr:MFS transporter [Verrucomicrobiae bacterium]